MPISKTHLQRPPTRHAMARRSARLGALAAILTLGLVAAAAAAKPSAPP